MAWIKSRIPSFRSIGLHLNLKPIPLPKIFEMTATLRAAPDRAYQTGFPLEIRPILVHPVVVTENEIRWRMDLSETEVASLRFFTNEELAGELAKRLVEYQDEFREATYGR